jgi:glycosyltransferase involved in cell wall biosynthesis
MASDIAVSVVMPTFNQASRLALTLASLQYQRPPVGGWEAIVVDDGSTDDTSTVLDTFAKRLPLRVLRQRNSGRSAARNAGAGVAGGRTLVFCDGDRVCDPSFLAAHAEVAANGDAARVGLGEIREAYVTDLDGRRAELLGDISVGCARLARLARRPYFVGEVYRHLLGPDGVASSPLAWLCFLSGNVSLPRALFDHAGGFDEDFVEWGFEHFELGYRLAGLGAMFRHYPGAVNYHLAHRRETGFYESGIAASAVLLRRKHPQLPVEALVRLARGELSLATFRAAPDRGN